MCVCVYVHLGDSLSSLQKAVEQKETSRQQLREQLDAVERETRAKLLEIDAFNTQLKVNSSSANTSNNTGHEEKSCPHLWNIKVTILTNIIALMCNNKLTAQWKVLIQYNTGRHTASDIEIKDELMKPDVTQQ